MSRGFTIDQIVKFSHLVRPLLLSSIKDEAGDLAGVERQLADLLRDTRITRRLRGKVEAALPIPAMTSPAEVSMVSG